MTWPYGARAEVLGLMLAGRSNRQIDAELFISVKTTSVRVANILATLGASGRGLAAAVAHPLRFFDDDLRQQHSG